MGAAVVIGWLYARRLTRTMRRGIRPPTQSAEGEPAGEGRRRSITAADVAGMTLSSAAARARDDAFSVTERAGRAYIAAWLIYAAVVAVTVQLFGKFDIAAKVAVACAVLAPQLLIVMWALRVPLRRRLWILLFYCVTCLIVSLPFLVRQPDRATTLLILIPALFALSPAAAVLVFSFRRAQPFFTAVATVAGFFAGWALVLDQYVPELTNQVVEWVKQNPWLLLVGLVNIIAGVVVTFVLLHQRWSLRLAAIVIALTGAVLLYRDLQQQNLPPFLRYLCFAVVPVLEVFLLWLFFKFYAWLTHHATNELIQAHVCWALLTVYLLATTAVYRDAGTARLWFLSAFVLHIIVLHTLLQVIRRGRAAPEKRLLLLRTFGRTGLREDLLDDLNDTWRRIGPVDLIAATDVTSRTLTAAMLEAFLLWRSDEQFLHDEADVENGVKHKRSAIEADARYPVNATYCDESIWHEAFEALAADPDIAVLMDVRGFTADNEGCAWELDYLLRNKDLHHIVLLADNDTDLKALDEIIRKTSATGVLTVLTFDRRSVEDRRALFDLLLNAAYADVATPLSALR
jgi:hypothetical protein